MPFRIPSLVLGQVTNLITDYNIMGVTAPANLTGAGILLALQLQIGGGPISVLQSLHVLILVFFTLCRSEGYSELKDVVGEANIETKHN